MPRNIIESSRESRRQLKSFLLFLELRAFLEGTESQANHRQHQWATALLTATTKIADKNASQVIPLLRNLIPME